MLVGKYKGHNCIRLEEGVQRLQHRLAYVVDVADGRKERLQKEINRVKDGANSVQKVINT